MPSETTRIIFLGTGTPNPDPRRQGQAIAIEVNGRVYLVDAGVGIVRQAVAAGLTMNQLDRVFITHLHSDHTIGLPDLILTPAITGRLVPIQIYGPKGIDHMVNHISQAWKEDIEVRTKGGEPSVPEAYKTDVFEFDAGSIYRDDNVEITAFPVMHGAWKHAFGFRVVTPDRVIVISGDTTYCPAVIANATECDVLIHEAYSETGLKNRALEWQAYHSAYHTSGPDVGRIAAAINPKLLILNHVLTMGQSQEQLIGEVKSRFNDEVVIASDLDVY